MKLAKRVALMMFVSILAIWTLIVALFAVSLMNRQGQTGMDGLILLFSGAYPLIALIVIVTIGANITFVAYLISQREIAKIEKGLKSRTRLR